MIDTLPEVESVDWDQELRGLTARPAPPESSPWPRWLGVAAALLIIRALRRRRVA